MNYEIHIIIHEKEYMTIVILTNQIINRIKLIYYY